MVATVSCTALVGVDAFKLELEVALFCSGRSRFPTDGFKYRQAQVANDQSI